MATESKRQALTWSCLALAAAMAIETLPIQARAEQTTPVQVAAVTGATAASPARELVTKYCVGCHNERVKSGNLLLDKADAADVSRSAETWEKVAVKLRARAMPPPGRTRPDAATYDAVAAWLEAELDRAAALHPNPGRPADFHRLNRTEYANAVRDLLGVAIDGTAMLPPDEQAYGFDPNADALAVTPALLDRYLSAATAIARLAVGDPTIPPTFTRYTAVKNNTNERTWLWQTDRLDEEFPLGSRGGIAARHYFPVDGEYVFKVRLDRTWEGLIRGLNVPNQIEIRVDGVRIQQFTIGGGSKPSLLTADEALEIRIPLKAGLRQVIATVVKSDAVKPEGLGPARMPIWSLQSHFPSSQLMVSSLLIGGPYNGEVPRESPSRRRIFSCDPVSTREATACATRILTTLARRAYRRPTTDEDVQTLLGFYQTGSAEGDFETGIRAAIERLLVSPDFLFRI
jgi:mono/diheme cytochrome c family protein